MPKKKKNPHRILIFDIESTNLVANYGQILVVGFKWYGDAKKTPTILRIDNYPLWKKDRTDDSALAKAFLKVWETADIVISWYGKRFDEPFLRSRLLAANDNKALKPVAHTDLYFTARYKLKLHSNRLQSVQEFLGLSEEKTKLTPRHWARARTGYKDGLDYVAKHCAQDVLVTEQAYERLLPHVSNHPNLQAIVPPADKKERRCPRCASVKLILVGYKPEVIHRWYLYLCRNCEGYSKAPPTKPWATRAVR